VLRRGTVLADKTKDEISQEELTQLMAGEEDIGSGSTS